jgi:regulation of enolase protein 1 (concanavalin A-like superfamily)
LEPWASPPGRWLNPPPEAVEDDGALIVTAAKGSDLWRDTSYGFRHENAHALLRPLPQGSAIEVAFVADFDGTFDQAGALLWVDEATWLKTGIEISDGVAQLGAVATRGLSDWSMAPVPDWHGREVTVRLSRSGDAVTVRARVDDDPWRMVRLAPLDPDAAVEAGPFCCAPERDGLRVRFTAWRSGPADTSLH